MKCKSLIVFLFLILFPVIGYAGDVVKVGVLANRGYHECVKKWQPTMRYLEKKAPPYQFELIPLAFDDILPAVQHREIDFIICNSAIFVDIEAIYGATAIATLKNKLLDGYYSVFGGVIFTRSSNNSIKTLHDLKGKTFLATDKVSLGGWQVQWRELKKVGIDPYTDFSKLTFAGQQDAVVFEVLKGTVDAGACRTDILESLARQGKINLKDINVIAEGVDVQVSKNEFPFLVSTRLYPEWPFAKLFHTSHEIASRISLALQSMKNDDEAAMSGDYGGWSYPLNYKPVHELQMELQIGYYKRLAPMGIKEVFQKYRKEITIASLLFIIISVALTSVSILYKRLSALKKKLDIELHERLKVEEELRQANSKLEHFATTDALTLVANRRKFDECFLEEWRRMARDKKPLSLILADIDHFKKYNDFYGHQAGDECLFKVAQEVGNYVRRAGDLLARYGGEEFVIILPSTDETSAVMIAERIRLGIEALKLPHEASPVVSYVTLSLGIATTIPEQNNYRESLIKAADVALYKAKMKGRNCISV